MFLHLEKGVGGGGLFEMDVLGQGVEEYRPVHVWLGSEYASS